MKLSGRRASEAAENLDSILRNIDGEPPTFRAVITGTGPVATTKNGVLTFPLAQLRP
ncbi:hypothetical protein R6G69_07345 [Actinotignum urinale]|uniref:hypothetical protein n=1 Tax=Actinotignum urinale TaxID=190146 RepID=UPI002A7F1DCE|nr:hypothetical protein [Actinotignum urinale]MDY5129790.1 hypothetical protein [Actinotignum urinale]